MFLAGECKHVIATYLACMKKARGVNDPDCRDLAKSYLACRMDKYIAQYRIGMTAPLTFLAGTSWPKMSSRTSGSQTRQTRHGTVVRVRWGVKVSLRIVHGDLRNSG